MLAVSSPSVAGPAIDWSNAYSTAHLPKSGAEELARRAAAGEVVGRGRLVMTKVDKQTEQKVRHERAEQRVEKGCCKETFHDLVGMAKNTMHFIELCAEEADKRAGHTNLRKQFRDAKADDVRQRGPFSKVETSAWCSRPTGCDSLKEALLLYATQLEKRVAAEKNPTGILLIQTELDQAHEAIAKLNAAAMKSQVKYQFPESGGFIMIQKATAAFAADEDRRIARGQRRMTLTEKLERWPCLAPGWPDETEGRLLREELEIRRLERGDGKRGLQEPDAPITRKKPKHAAAGSSSLAPRALSPSLLPVAAMPPALVVPGEPDAQDIADADELVAMFGDDDAEYPAPPPVAAEVPAPADRRFEVEAPRAAVVTQLAPSLVQAFAKGLQRDQFDLSDFDPAEVAMYKQTVLLFDPKTRRPRTPTRKDLLKKGLCPVPPGAAAPSEAAAPPAPSAKMLGKRPVQPMK